MAFTRLGIGGMFIFDDSKAQPAIQRTDRSLKQLRRTNQQLAVQSQVSGRKVESSFNRMARAAQRLRTATQQVGAGLRNVAIGALPMTLALKKAVGTAAGFQHQMFGVRAILKDIGEKEFTQLADKAKTMGVVSVFSAKQSAEAMEFLARAGFRTNEIMGAIDQTIYAAAAEGMGLADASRLIANNVRAFGLEAKEAGRVADVLALTSARTNTTMIELGEGMKFAAPIARGLGIQIEETATVLGLLADSGLQGSLSGTALKNSMLKLAAPTGAGAKALKKLGLNIRDAHGDFIGFESVLRQLQSGLNTVGGAVDRTAAAAQLFGLRGVAITNLLGRLDKAAEGGALTFAELHKQLKNANGAAKEMADIRLKSLQGRLTLLKSSIEAAFIETFEPALAPLAGTVNDLIGGEGRGLNGVLFVIQDIKKQGLDTWRTNNRAAMESAKGLSTVQQIALGVMDAIQWMQEAWNKVIAAVQRAGKWIKDAIGGEGVRAMTALIIKIGIFLAVLAPALLILGLLKLLIGGLIGVVIGLGKVMLLAFSPAILMVGAIVLVLYTLRDVISEIAAGFIGPLWKSVKKAFGSIVKAVSKVLDAITRIFFVSEEAAEGTSSAWEKVAWLIGSTLGVALEAIATLVEIIADTLTMIIDAVLWLPRKLGLIAEKTEAVSKKSLRMFKEGRREMQGTTRAFNQGVREPLREYRKGIPDWKTAFMTSTRDGLQSGIAATVWPASFFANLQKGTGDALRKAIGVGLKARQLMEFGPRAERLAGGMSERVSKDEGRKRMMHIARVRREETRNLRMREAREKDRQKRIQMLGRMSPAQRERFIGKELAAEFKAEAELRAKAKGADINITNRTCIDGRDVSASSSKHQAQIQERIAAKTKRYHTQIQREHGAFPATVKVGSG